MSTDLVTLDQRQMDVLRNALCKDATPDEMHYFAMVCQRKGLDPFSGEICLVKRGGRPVVQTQIDGFRSQAEKSGEYDGQDEPEYDCEPGGTARFPAWCRVTVYRFMRGSRRPFTARVFWGEFCQDGNPSWKKMPWHMLAKCAEALAIKKAFPKQTGGLTEGAEPVYADEGPAPAGRAADVQASLDAPKVPPELAGKWNEALGAFSGLGESAAELLAFLGLDSPAQLTVAHLDTLRAHYTTLSQQQSAQ